MISNEFEAMLTLTPKNELETIIMFSRKMLGGRWEFVSVKPSFPDAVIRDLRNLAEYNAEFEFKASNFKAHGHNLMECDVIICWENDWPDCPVTVWDVRSWSGEEVITRANEHVVEIAQLRIENKKLRKRLAAMMISSKKEAASSDDKLPVRDTRNRRIRFFNDARNGIIDPLSMTGQSIAEMYGVGEATGRRWKRKWKENGGGAVKVEAPEVLE